MRSTIDELWFSNVGQSNQSQYDTPESKKLLELIVDNRERLCNGLTEAQKERLRCYDDCVEELKELDERDAFAYGFRLGLRLAAEAFSGL